MRRAILTVAAVVFVGVFGVVFYYLGPGGTGVLSRLTLPDGSEFRLIQRYNYSTEPYTIDFFFRLPNAPWGWCYIDHQDNRWRTGRLQFNGAKKAVEVYCGADLRAEYFTDRHTFALYSHSLRELPAPQEVRDPPL
jgi:hypothetical protein